LKIILWIDFQSLRGTLESVERERQKAIRDLSATNQRVAVFAQGLNLISSILIVESVSPIWAS